MLTLLAFLATFSILVLVHECGHFFAARASGVRVEEFGFGFPPRIMSRRIGQTRYSFNLIPIGGFVRLYGEGGEGKGERDSFAAQSFLRKIFIVLAGVTMNVLLTVLLLAILFYVGVNQSITSLYPKAKITERSLVVTHILPDSPAAKSGIQAGDLLRSMNGTPLENVATLRSMVERRAGERVAIEIERSRVRSKTTLIPMALKDVENRVAIGVGLEEMARVSYPVHLAPLYAVRETWVLTKEMGGVLSGLARKILLQRTTRDLGVTGPIGIAVLSGRFARAGASSFLFFIALLSLNLALLNVLPLPALDGGRAAIIIGERLAGRTLHRKIETVIQTLGIVFILLLALLVTVEDLRMYTPMVVNALTVK
jgi:regulator of sigma E protease